MLQRLFLALKKGLIMIRRTFVFSCLSIVLALTILAPASFGAAVIFEAAGPNAAAIQSAVDSFRTALGPSNGADSPASTGRREINWDGVPITALDPFPGGFFNSSSPRGVVFSTPGSRFKASGDPSSTSFLMKDVTAQEWGLIEFASFSPERIFAPIGSVITDVHFFVPGTQTPASVRGFGAVFVDVDVAGPTRFEAYDAQGRLLAGRAVPLSGARSKGFSFVGLLFDAGERIRRVRLITGTAPIDSPFQDPPPDGVALDDLIYAEPQALSDPMNRTTWVAAAYKGPGANGSDWRTDLALLNPSGVPASYRVDLLQGGTTKSISGTLSGGRQVVLTDVIGQAGGNGFFVIRVVSDQDLEVSSSTFNQVSSAATCLPGGRQGSSTFGRTEGEILNQGRAALLPHLQEDGTARTNFGVTNTGTTTATVTVTLFDDPGQVITAFDLVLAPGEVRQVNQVFSSRGGRSDITFGSARVVVKFGNGIIAYASVVDNITNDPRQVEMFRY
jgi:hypothetical protein